jgi:hypothetical protein
MSAVQGVRRAAPKPGRAIPTRDWRTYASAEGHP